MQVAKQPRKETDMKIIQKILAIIAILTFILVLFVGFCAFNPDLSRNIGSFLNSHGIGSAVSPAVSSLTSSVSQSAVSSANSGSADATVIVDTAGTAISSDAADIAHGTVSGSYIAPSEDSLDIPSSVSEKSGYIPVEGHEKQVSDNNSNSLISQAGTGETGSGLTFDPVKYPYYAMLDESAKKIYCQIYANMNALNDSFAPVNDISPDGLRNAFTAVCNDHPELFWVDTAYGYSYDSTGKIAVIGLEFNSAANDLGSSKAVFDKAAAALIVSAQNETDDHSKETALHDALISHVSYNRSSPMNQSAYSAIVNGSTVCAGYAKAFQYLCQQTGLTCYYCTGFSGENHAWDIIKLDDGFYNVDTTWDDTDPSTYDYFNCSDADFSSTHIRKDLSVNLPACTGEKYREQPTVTGTVSDSSASDNYTSADVLSDIDSYYADCLSQLESSDGNPVVFTNTISDSSLLSDIKKAFDDNSYQNGFGSQILKDRNASGMYIQISAEQTDGGHYLLTHTVTFR